MSTILYDFLHRKVEAFTSEELDECYKQMNEYALWITIRERHQRVVDSTDQFDYDKHNYHYQMIDECQKNIFNHVVGYYIALDNMYPASAFIDKRKKPSDSVWFTLNTFGENKLNKEELIELINKLLKASTFKQVNEYVWSIELGEQKNNPHCHFLCKHSYVGCDAGAGSGTHNTPLPYRKTFKYKVDKFLRKHYPDIQYDIRVEPSLYVNRKKYVIKDGEYFENALKGYTLRKTINNASTTEPTKDDSGKIYETQVL